MGWIKVLGLGIVSFVSFLYLVCYILLSAIFAISVAFVSTVLILSWKIPRWVGIEIESNAYLLCFIGSILVISCGIAALVLKILRVL